MENIIFIVGPTATGKTEVSLLLARRLGAEIVSCDSMLVYRELNVITSKPGAEALAQIPHHFVNVISVEEMYNVFDYCGAAQDKIDSLAGKNVPVIACGGSGLYVKALLDGLADGGARDEELRRALEEKAKERGSRYLWEELDKVDKQTAAKLSPRDLRRIIRALEVYHTRGVPIGQVRGKERGIYGRLPVRIFGLRMKRDKLYARINERTARMFAQGAVDEVRELVKRRLSITAAKVIGIKEISRFLSGEITQAAAQEEMARNTRRFAKRQVTWFKADKRVEWIDVDRCSAEDIAEQIRVKMSL